MNVRELCAAMQVSDEMELLRRFPSRYEDLTPTPLKAEPQDSERFVVKGTVVQMRNFQASGRSLIRFSLTPFGGREIPCMIYNQPFYLSKVSKGKEILAVLYYSSARKVYMVQSLFDLDSYPAMTGIRPVYPLPKGVSNSYFTSVLKKALSAPRPSPVLVSPIPSSLRTKYRFLDEFEAFRCVHFPRNWKDLNDGLRVLKYEEALSYAIRSLSIKKEADQKKKEGGGKISHEAINDFVRSLSYRLTKDQLIAIKEIVLDMESSKPMYRLLQGDVGTGKTIVSFLSLYANRLRGKQGVLMAPTFELARQHYQNALKTFSHGEMKIAFLGGNLKAKERREILSGLADGSIDVLISTDAAVSKDVLFRSLGLTIVDEQQRFGVSDRENLLRKGDGCDLLMMSATPIPRTLSQIINMDVDVSTLTEFPHGQRKVRTEVMTRSDPLLYKAIDKALAAGRQIFIVAPKIDKGGRNSSSATEVYEEIKERYPDKAQLLHGRIKKEEQDLILERFASKEKLILVSTTVIEVGIDVSEAALLIVYDANYFGLSSLHQLRGRIGRSGDFALALLVYDGGDPEAKAKLDFLASSNDGLEIAKFDLKQRGAGSYGGSSQSGKSELMVCNFVEDFPIFKAAKEDAIEILSHPEKEGYSDYLKKLGEKGDLFLS